MRRLLKKLPLRHKDTSSDQRPSSPPKPIKATSPRTPTIFYDADDNDNNELPETTSNGRPKTAQSKDGTLSNRTSPFGETRKRESALVSCDQPVDPLSVQRSDTCRSNTKKSDHGLHLAPQGTSLYDDLSYLTLGGDSRDSVDPSRKRYSEDVAVRNLMSNEKGPLSDRKSAHRESISVQAPAQFEEFPEDIADRNIERPNSQKASAVSAPWKLKSHQVALGQHVNTDSGFLGDFETSSSSSEAGAIIGPGTEASEKSFKRNEQALPPKPSTGADKIDYKDLDFTDSIDTDVRTRYAPAVTHETVIPEVRHVEREVMTREIHNHDVYHRILPIKDVEILPAKHFVRSPSAGNLTEIQAPPGREGEHQKWKIVSTESDSGWQPAAPRPFTARTFENDEGMAKVYTGEDGVPRTELTWIHPPTVQDGGQKTGQTEALFLDELHKPRVKGGSKGIPGGWSDGVHDYDNQFCNGYHDGPDMQVHRRPVGAGARH